MLLWIRKYQVNHWGYLQNRFFWIRLSIYKLPPQTHRQTGAKESLRQKEGG